MITPNGRFRCNTGKTSFLLMNCVRIQTIKKVPKNYLLLCLFSVTSPVFFHRLCLSIQTSIQTRGTLRGLFPPSSRVCSASWWRKAPPSGALRPRTTRWGQTNDQLPIKTQSQKKAPPPPPLRSKHYLKPEAFLRLDRIAKFYKKCPHHLKQVVTWSITNMSCLSWSIIAVYLNFKN